MKVLCINPPDDLAALLGDGASFVSTMEPLGLLYVAAALALVTYGARARRTPRFQLA